MDLLDAQVQFEFLPFLRVYKSGRFQRFLTSTTAAVAASVDPATAVASKDVVVDPDTGVSARLYLPNLAGRRPRAKLPLLVYFHGGGFCFESPRSATYHHYLNALVARACVAAVSVDYRLAPEHPVPAAYDDSWAVLRWAFSHAAGTGPEAWLANYVDFESVYLAGDSAGANIAHNMAMRAGREGGVSVRGLALVHPYFWGEERLDGEEAEDGGRMLQPATLDAQWPALCPERARGNDDPRLNPVAEGAPSLKELGCRRAVVSVAERDLLRARGKAYYEALRRSGWGGEAELVETEGEDHVFHLFDPYCEKAQALMERLVAFLSG